jgi:hypothetical protein
VHILADPVHVSTLLYVYGPPPPKPHPRLLLLPEAAPSTSRSTCTSYKLATAAARLAAACHNRQTAACHNTIHASPHTYTHCFSHCCHCFHTSSTQQPDPTTLLSAQSKHSNTTGLTGSTQFLPSWPAGSLLLGSSGAMVTPPPGQLLVNAGQTSRADQVNSCPAGVRAPCCWAPAGPE